MTVRSRICISLTSRLPTTSLLYPLKPLDRSYKILRILVFPTVRGRLWRTFSCLIASLNSSSKCYDVCFYLGKKIRKIGQGVWHHYPLAFKRKKGPLLFAKIERFLLPVSIHLANGKIAALWKSIDQYARRQWRRSCDGWPPPFVSETLSGEAKGIAIVTFFL